MGKILSGLCKSPAGPALQDRPGSQGKMPGMKVMNSSAISRVNK
jgi:hypothetical protein